MTLGSWADRSCSASHLPAPAGSPAPWCPAPALWLALTVPRDRLRAPGAYACGPMTDSVAATSPNRPEGGEGRRSTHRAGRPIPAAVLLVVVGVAALALGILTDYGQGWLPARLSSLSNSSGSWALAAFLLALPARRALVAASCGALTLIALLGGYVLAAEIHGISQSAAVLAFWTIAGLLAGPALGLSAHLVRSGAGRAAALATGIPAGVLIGEGIYGLRVIAATTYPPYWWAQIILGVLLLTVIAATRLRKTSLAVLAIGSTAVIAVAFVAIYSANLIGAI